MANLKTLEYKYPKNYRAVFEDISTLIFCKTLGLDKGVTRRTNQKGIESDPVIIGSEKYAYASKYYDQSTRLSSRKSDIIQILFEASAQDITHLMIFINKDLPDIDPITGKGPSYFEQIQSAAKSVGIEIG